MLPVDVRVVPTITFTVIDPTAALGDARDARSSRAKLLSRALVIGGGVVAGGIAIGGLPGLSLARSSPAQDVRVLNLLLLLEYVQAAFYADANKHASLTGELAEFSRTVGTHEDKHVAFFKKALGSKARAKPRVNFGGATRTPRAFTAAAIALEDLGVAAYNGQATNVTRKTLAAAATIVSVEARHAAWIRDIAGRLPAISPIDPAATEAEMLKRLRATGYLKSP
jgi:hypothetical protein